MSDRRAVRVGYEDIEAQQREDTRVRAIFKKDTGEDEYIANRALPPAFAYHVELTQGAIDELESIPGVWVRS